MEKLAKVVALVFLGVFLVLTYFQMQARPRLGFVGDHDQKVYQLHLGKKVVVDGKQRKVTKLYTCPYVTYIYVSHLESGNHMMWKSVRHSMRALRKGREDAWKGDGSCYTLEKPVTPHRAHPEIRFRYKVGNITYKKAFKLNQGLKVSGEGTQYVRRMDYSVGSVYVYRTQKMDGKAVHEMLVLDKPYDNVTHVEFYGNWRDNFKNVEYMVQKESAFVRYRPWNCPASVRSSKKFDAKKQCTPAKKTFKVSLLDTVRGRKIREMYYHYNSRCNCVVLDLRVLSNERFYSAKKYYVVAESSSQGGGPWQNHGRVVYDLEK